jgi:hypothetical protein
VLRYARLLLTAPALRDRDVRRHRPAAVALAELVCTGSYDRLDLRPHLADADRTVRLQCALVLWFQGDDGKPVMDVLVEAWRNGTEKDREKIDYVVRNLEEPARIAAARSLLEECMRGPDEGDRQSAADKHYLGMRKVDAVLPVFLDGIDLKGDYPSLPAVRGLQYLGPKAAEGAPCLVALYRTHHGNRIGRNLGEALVAIGPAAAPP